MYKKIYGVEYLWIYSTSTKEYDQAVRYDKLCIIGAFVVYILLVLFQ